MKLSQIALQLYTLRDYLKTPADVAATLKKVRSIGYETIQVSGMGPIPEADLMTICKGEGLKICGTHEPSAMVLENPAAIAERLHKLGCTLTAYPFPAGIDFADASCVAKLIKDLEASGKVLREAGCCLTYHNHANEFLRVGGRTVLEQIYAETSPENLQAELDTYWIQFGGGDSTAWVRKMAGRLPWLHLKDYAFTAENKPMFAEVGSGNLDWGSIIPAAEEAGCQWFIVEQDTCPGDPFDSVAQSLAYLKSNFLKA
ncbi:sugar phosphate isomerase/epimerase [soil metagenome]